MAIVIIWGMFAGLLGSMGIRARVLRKTEAEEVDVLGQSGGALGRALHQLGTPRAANGPWVPLGQVPKAGLAGRVPTRKHPRDRALAVVVLEAHRALRQLHRHYFAKNRRERGQKKVANTTPFRPEIIKSLNDFQWENDAVPLECIY